MNKPLLTCQNLRKTYRDRKHEVSAVKDISLTLESGGFLAIQGGSGSGKSTLLHMAGGLLRPDAGQVEVDGVDIHALASDARARFRGTTIGFVFQQFHLIPYLSVAENVAAAAGKEKDGLQDRVDALLEDLGIADRRSHEPSRLSVGERQRVSLARALVNMPKLILADEPTGNLDPHNADIVLARLEAFVAKGGGVLLVTHSPDAASRAQRSIHLKQGESLE